MEAKTVVFKNGVKLKIAFEIFNTLGKILKNPTAPFQVFADSNGKILLILNLDNIAYIK